MRWRVVQTVRRTVRPTPDFESNSGHLISPGQALLRLGRPLLAVIIIRVSGVRVPPPAPTKSLLLGGFRGETWLLEGTKPAHPNDSLMGAGVTSSASRSIASPIPSSIRWM